MLKQQRFPLTPRLSSLAEVVAEFEGSDPEACALLLPLQEDLGPGVLEVRARQKLPSRVPEDRAVIVERAVALVELATVGRSSEDSEAPAKPASPTGAARTRLHMLLVAALTRRPALTAREGLQLINAEPGVAVAAGTFHKAYWHLAMQLLPPAVRDQRDALTARRKGKGKVHTSTKQRVQTLECATQVTRQRPDLHDGAIMDEVRRRTGIPFRDPVAFRRNYLDKIARSDPTHGEDAQPTLVVVSTEIPAAEVEPVPPTHEEPEDPTPPVDTAESGFALLLSAADPLAPAALAEADGGLVHITLKLRPVPRRAAYQFMGWIYAEMAAREDRVDHSPGNR